MADLKFSPPSRAWLVLALCLLGGQAQAANVYKYKNDKGQWVITDKPPPGAAAGPARSRLRSSSQ